MGTFITPGFGQGGLSQPGTSLTSNPGMMQLENGFNRNIFPMFGPASATPSPAGPLTTLAGNPSTLTPSGVGNLTGTLNNNPGMTNQFYPNQSLLQTTAPNLITAGSSALNAGLGTTGSAVSALTNALNFEQGITSGNPNDITQMVAPYAANIAKIFAGATTQTSEGTPEGGFRSLGVANEPFAQASMVGNEALSLIPTALAGETQIGQILGTIGQGLAGTALGLTGQGLQASQAAMTGANQKQQINQEAGSVFGDIMKALSVAGNVAGGVGGLLSGIAAGGGGGGGDGGGGSPSGVDIFNPSYGNYYNPPPISGDPAGSFGAGGYPFP